MYFNPESLFCCSRVESCVMLLVATLLAAGIYPDGHWTRATKLTPANFEGFVESQVDAGKTLFVRWIASEG